MKVLPEDTVKGLEEMGRQWNENKSVSMDSAGIGKTERHSTCSKKGDRRIYLTHTNLHRLNEDVANRGDATAMLHTCTHVH